MHAQLLGSARCEWRRHSMACAKSCAIGLGPAAAAFLELMWEHVKSIKKEALVPVKSRCMAVLSVGLFRAQARRLLHLSPAGAVFGAHMPAPPATGE